MGEDSAGSGEASSVVRPKKFGETGEESFILRDRNTGSVIQTETPTRTSNRPRMTPFGLSVVEEDEIEPAPSQYGPPQKEKTTSQ